MFAFQRETRENGMKGKSLTDLRNGTGRIHGRFNRQSTRGLLVLYRTSVTDQCGATPGQLRANSGPTPGQLRSAIGFQLAGYCCILCLFSGRGSIPFILGTGRIHRVHYDGRGFPGARDNGTISSFVGHPLQPVR